MFLHFISVAVLSRFMSSIASIEYLTFAHAFILNVPLMSLETGSWKR